MNLFPYREETDDELLRAAAQAYREAPPERNTEISVFGWTVAEHGRAGLSLDQSGPHFDGLGRGNACD